MADTQTHVCAKCPTVWGWGAPFFLLLPLVWLIHIACQSSQQCSEIDLKSVIFLEETLNLVHPSLSSLKPFLDPINQYTCPPPDFSRSSEPTPDPIAKKKHFNVLLIYFVIRIWNQYWLRNKENSFHRRRKLSKYLFFYRTIFTIPDGCFLLVQTSFFVFKCLCLYLPKKEMMNFHINGWSVM